MNFAKRLNKIVRELADLKDEFREAIQDTQHYSLEDRWEMFEKAPVELVRGGSEAHLVGEQLIAELMFIDGDLSLYDDLSIDRYQTVNMCDIVEGIVEENTSGEESYEQAFSKCMLNTDFTSLLELILQSGIREFMYDW